MLKRIQYSVVKQAQIQSHHVRIFVMKNTAYLI